MKQLSIRILIAFLTFSFGMIATTIWMIRPTQLAKPLEIPNKQSNFVRLMPPIPESKANEQEQVPSPAAQSAVKPISIDDICESRDKLKYQEYQVIRTFNPDTHISSIIVKKGRKVLATHAREVLDADGVRMGLFSLLSRKTKQLIIEQISGGAHCCYSYWIYDLYPRFHLIFESNKYPVEDYMNEARFLDVNKDGVFELIATLNSFAYFYSVFSGSVMPEVVFRYEKTAREYYPANRVFLAFALDGIEEEKRKIGELNKEIAAGELPGLEYIYYMLDVVLRYIYAGKEKEAWAYYDKKYKLNEFAKKEEFRKDIKKVLRKDSIYRFIYHR